MQTHKWMLAAAAATTFLAACSSKEAAEESPTVTVQVAAAESKPIEQVVSADAILFPRDQAAIVPQISAPVKKFYVDRGSRVHAGELLAELDNQSLAGAYVENQGSYQEAQTNYDTAAQKAQQDLTLAKQQMDAAQKVYDGRQNLLKQGAVSAKDVEDARISLTQAQNQYATAQKHYDLKVAEAQLTAAKGKATAAEAELNYAKITSPIDGVVTDRPFYAGETAPSGSPILTVMDISQIVARAHIAQDQALRLKPGDAATIAAAGSNPDEPLKGKVTLVSPALDPNSTTVEVWVAAPNPGEKLKPGSSARISIIAQTVPHAIVVPAEALLTATDGSTSVMVLGTDNKPKKQDVKVGIRNGDDAQITDGLKGGERVITTGAFELSTEDPDVLAKTAVQVAPAKPASGDDAN
jgi:multidrug efflux pump subunit AcrA (membrane-fusion protein)